MSQSHRHFPLVGAVALGLVHCGGQSTAGSDGGNPDAGCLGAPGGSGPRVPIEHRAQAKACNPAPGQFMPDAGAASCTTDADCGGVAGSTLTNCLRGICSYDQCLTDADCPSQHVCDCEASTGRLNFCVPADCHVDSDCAASGYCSPSRGRCGVIEGFYCHKPADPCVNPTTDCAGCGGFACVYAPTVGYFVCGGSVCNG
jgi:hypothetical protein